MAMLSASLLALAVTSAATPLGEAISKVVATESAKYNCSIAAAVYSESRGVSEAAAAGSISFDPNAGETKVDDQFVWGSITKISTGAAILKLAQEGKLSINDTIPQYVDPMLAAMKAEDPSLNFSSCSDIWGEEVNDVTIFDLASMNSGIPDFDTAKPYPPPPKDPLRATLYAKPAQDWTPPELLGVPWVSTGKLDFPPGKREHWSYSSTNFILLGLILAQQSGAKRWQDFDQSSFLPEDIKAKLPSVRYVSKGAAPKDVTRLVGYDRTSYNGQSAKALPGVDVRDVHGVFAGWSASDYTSTVADAARLAYEVYGPKQRIINATNQNIMVPYCSSSHSFECIYGFATFNLTDQIGQKGDMGTAYGHIGATYGFDTMLSYHPALDITIAIGSNMENDDQTHPSDTLCLLFTAVKNALTGSQDKCSYEPRGYYGGECKCE